LLRTITGDFPQDYVPTAVENTLVLRYDEVTQQEIEVGLWDTAGREDYDRLRPLSYPATNCFVLAFSVISRVSFQNIAAKWIPEITHHCPGVPFILVGLKSDLRNDVVIVEKLASRNERVVDREEAMDFAAKLGARYVETSALTGEGVDEFSDAIVDVGLAHMRGDVYGGKRKKGGLLGLLKRLLMR